MSTATTGHPSGSLRVSDADRDRAIAELSEHYQAGRLTTEEFEDRTGRALQARTTADLAALFTDLPRRQAPMTGASMTGAPMTGSTAGATGPDAPSTAPASAASAWPARVPVAPVTILAVVAVLALLSGHLFHIAWVPVVAIIVVRLLAGGRRREAREAHYGRYDGRHWDRHHDRHWDRHDGRHWDRLGPDGYSSRGR
jgi:hypothetical protein